MVYKCQVSILLLESKHAAKRQLCGRPFTLREAAAFIFRIQRFLACILHTTAPNADPDPCPLEVNPHLQQAIYRQRVNVHEMMLYVYNIECYFSQSCM